ncbi:glycoside hydrolase 5 family protein [Nafulsella turpanensis]|uniref:glycoside hydrolase 5 family protein n=1 Tax=Nafulsella turpanensis TaxID=1265690 RepID=UPI000348BDFC|nr:cellulase family glycosylhydrolase [Nafulsella turpanensis]
MQLRLLLYLLFFLPAGLSLGQGKEGFVQVKNDQFIRNGQPYYFLGANYWYGMNLASTARGGDRERLKRELDHLQSIGIKNLRIMAATEGPDTEPNRMRPSLQPSPGMYNEEVLEGLDFLLAEMAKRDMTAVLVMTNFWEWTGGMGQYISWADGVEIPYAPPAGDGDWDTFQKFSSSFFSNKKANRLYRKHLKFIINRENKITGVKYKEDPTIMAWQLGNEPRGYNNQEAYRKWIHKTAGYIKRKDKNHLVSIGSEGNTGSHHAGNDFYRDHLSPRIDYATMHIWIQNWAWFDPKKSVESLPAAMEKAEAYLLEHVEAAKRLNKPMVLEEFGVARDGEAYAPGSPVVARDTFFKLIFEMVYEQARAGNAVAGANFWTYSGEGRPAVAEGGNYWQEGDALMGDPPHEKQGWYSVFDSDSSTIAIIRKYARLMNQLRTETEVSRR